MRFAHIIPALLLGCLASTAQIVSLSEVVDFGLMKESEGPKTVRTYVKNISTEPQTLLKVRPTCGCTAADFQKTPFAPGDSAWIDLTYNPVRRPGEFSKEVRVYPTDGEMLLIAISGTVMASESTLHNLYPVDYGCLRLSDGSFMAPRPLSNEIKTFVDGTYNNCDSDLYITVESEDETVGVDVFPNPLPPANKGLIEISVNPLNARQTGRQEYILKVYVSDSPETPAQSDPLLLKINAVIGPQNP